MQPIITATFVHFTFIRTLRSPHHDSHASAILIFSSFILAVRHAYWERDIQHAYCIQLHHPGPTSHTQTHTHTNHIFLQELSDAHVGLQAHRSMSKRGAVGQGGEERYGGYSDQGGPDRMEEAPRQATAAQMAKRK